MGYFDSIQKLNIYRRSVPFEALNRINRRADRILEKCTSEQIEKLAHDFQEFFTEFKDELLAEETEDYIRRLSERGGWELKYLPQYEEGYHANIHDIRELIYNWPSWADDKPDLPSNSYVSDFDNLQFAIDTNRIYEYEGLSGFSSSCLYAILAKLKIDDAACMLQVPQEKSSSGTIIYPGQHPWTKVSIITAADLLIEATETICYAERAFSDDQLRENRLQEIERMNASIFKEAEEIVRNQRVSVAKSGGLKRAAKTEWVESEVIRLYDAGTWKNATHAAHELTPIIVEMSKGRGDLMASTQLPLKIIRAHIKKLSQ